MNLENKVKNSFNISEILKKLLFRVSKLEKNSKANSYSADEVLTGGTWIDGKPIYRKVIEIADFGNSLEFVYAYDADIMLISAKTLIKSIDIPNTYMQEYYRNTTSGYSGRALSTEIAYDTKELYVYYTTFTEGEGEWVTCFANDTGCIILEYTKTTD